MPATKECLTCYEDYPEEQLSYPGCNEHGLCHQCLIRMVETVTNNECNYPLKCPGCDFEVPDEKIFRLLSMGDANVEAVLDNFYEKAEEYRVLQKQRIWCGNMECQIVQGHSRFLNPVILGDESSVICPDCDEVTCRLCKKLRMGSEPHFCNEDKGLDSELLNFIGSLSEEERWLWQKCYSCGVWVNKSEACNHMTCRCAAEFCLCCGREWAGLVSCKWGCPKYDKPVYDEEGFNQNDFNLITGLNREGLPWDPNHEYEGDDEDDLQYDEEGFDQYGWDYDGFDRNGFDRDGLDRDGRDADGFDRDGFDCTGRDEEGYFRDGCDLDGFDREGISLCNLLRDWYDEDGYDPFGEDVWGFSRAGFDFEGLDPHGYDVEGYNLVGYDKHGHGRDGFTEWGYDKHGRDRDGYRGDGYNCHHRDRDDKLDPAYEIGPDGNARRIEDEGPSAKAMECNHRTGFLRASATCYVCRWTSDIFHHKCFDCEAALCRACDGSVEGARERVRERYLWPGADSYDIDVMFNGREKAEACIKDADRA